MNIILGAVRELPYLDIYPFLESLRRTSFDGKVILYASQIDDETRQQLEARSVSLIFVENENRDTISVNCFRYFVYQRILDSLGATVENVLLTDVRDVLFQRNPFENMQEESLHFFLEDIPLRYCPFNSWWVLNAFGAATWEQLSEQMISCSGTTLGSATLMKRYVGDMVRLLNSTSRRLPSMTMNFAGIDQGLHNYLLYTQYAGEKWLRTWTNNNGPVFTMSYATPEELRFSDAGKLLNEQGMPYAILHQYDRHEQLAELLSPLFL